MNTFRTIILTIIFTCQMSFCVEFVNYLGDDAKNNIHDIAVHNDTIWLATWDGGVLKRDINGNLLAAYSNADGLAGNDVRAVAIDSEGNKWFASFGVSVFDGVNWRTYGYSHGLASRSEGTAVALDRKGAMWYASFGGLSRFKGTTWTAYHEEDGPAYNWVNAIAIDSEDNKWFGTNGGVSMILA